MSKWFSTTVKVEYPSPSVMDGYATRYNRPIDYKIFFPHTELKGRTKCKIKRVSVTGLRPSIFVLNIKCKELDDLLVFKLST